MINVLSFDIEDWFHLLNVDSLSNTCQYDLYPQIVEPYTRLILSILADLNIRATFFIVGWVAKKYPHLVKEIDHLGHEIASHSHWHRPINRMTQKQFSDDLSQSIDSLQQITGKKVLGFRAPGLTLTKEVDWAFEVLLDLGLKYDSSLISHRPKSFGCSPGPQFFRKTPSKRLIFELPVSALPLGRFSFPYCSGGFLRLIPRPILLSLMKMYNSFEMPNVVYLHPRDFALDCPRVKLSPMRSFRTYYGIRSTHLKLESMLRMFQWDCCAAVLGLIPDYVSTKQLAYQTS